MRGWIKIITETIEKANKPLTREEITKDLVEVQGYHISSSNIGVQLNAAKNLGIIAHIKIAKLGMGFYCNPDWLNEDKTLKEEYKINPFWPNQNKVNLDESNPN